MKNILLISNLSGKNNQVIKYAADFCKHYKCKLHFLHVDEDSDAPILVSSAHVLNSFVMNKKSERYKAIADSITNVTDKFLNREWVHVQINSGNEEKLINNFINSNFIDLILFGKEDLKLKSVKVFQDLLLNAVETPLLVLPEDQIFSPFENLKYFTVHSKNDHQNIVQVSNLLPETSLQLINLNEEKNIDPLQLHKQKRWLEFLKDDVKNIKISYKSLEGNVENYLQNENILVKKKYDAFVFNTKRRNFWARFFDPSTTLFLMSTLEFPAFIFKSVKL